MPTLTTGSRPGAYRAKSSKSAGNAPEIGMRPFRQSLPMRLMLAREAVMQRFRPHHRAHGITEQQWRVIRALVEAGELEMMELSQRCCIRAPSLSRIIPKLEEVGLVQRRNHEIDQRRIGVSITSQGRTLFRTMARESSKIYDDLVRALGDKELAKLESALDHVLAVLGEPVESTSED